MPSPFKPRPIHLQILRAMPQWGSLNSHDEYIALADALGIVLTEFSNRMCQLIKAKLVTYTCETTYERPKHYCHPSYGGPWTVPGTSTWRITDTGIRLITCEESRIEYDRRVGRKREFRYVDRRLLWYLGSHGKVPLQTAMGGVPHDMMTDMLLRNSFKRLVLLELVIEGVKERGYFVGELTEAGRDKFREQFPGNEPKQ